MSRVGSYEVFEFCCTVDRARLALDSIARHGAVRNLSDPELGINLPSPLNSGNLLSYLSSGRALGLMACHVNSIKTPNVEGARDLEHPT